MCAVHVQGLLPPHALECTTKAFLKEVGLSTQSGDPEILSQSPQFAPQIEAQFLQPCFNVARIY